MRCIETATLQSIREGRGMINYNMRRIETQVI